MNDFRAMVGWLVRNGVVERSLSSDEESNRVVEGRATAWNLEKKIGGYIYTVSEGHYLFVS
jgi:hypothetical protein